MSTTTFRRGRLTRTFGLLALAATLVAAPAAAAADDPVGEAGTGAAPTPSASPSPTPSSEPTPSPSTTPSPTPSSEPTPSPSTTPSPTPSPTPGSRVVPGGRTTDFGPDASAGPATTTDPAELAGHYLAQQLRVSGYTFGTEIEGVEYPDFGLVADAVLALDAAGTGQDAAAQATATLAGRLGEYIGFDTDNDAATPDDLYAGSVAKVLNVAAAQGAPPRDFGGVDLVATLQGLERPTGRFSDSGAEDYSNTFTQSLAVMGLSRTGGTVSDDALRYLLAQQCPNGGFQLVMADGGCTADAEADPDSTAMAVQALLAVGGQTTAADAGLDFIVSRQRDDGGVGGSGPTASVNANSTGLAGQALIAGGRTAQARLAASYLTALQYDCSFPAALRGGVAYDTATFETKEAAGVDAVPTDQDRRSTAQAALALSETPLYAVTAEGADATAPAPSCATARPAPSRTPTVDISAPAGDSGGESTGAAAAPREAPKDAEDLARTGTDPVLPVLLGLLLLVMGAAAVIVSRPRGNHA
ncbi:MAG: prenyltransferase/squalene oxidase repeat-containing protein [Dermatophilaceae bacterium]